MGSDIAKNSRLRQVTYRGYSVTEVTNRLGITTKSLYDLIKRYGDDQAARSDQDQRNEIRRLKAKLRRADMLSAV